MSANELRRLCFQLLPTSADFEAFLLDRFPDVQRETSPAMLRSARMNVLLERHGVEAVWQALRVAFPLAFPVRQGESATGQTDEGAAICGTLEVPGYLDAPTVGEVGTVTISRLPAQQAPRRAVQWAALGLGIATALLAGHFRSALWPARQPVAVHGAGPAQQAKPASIQTPRLPEPSAESVAASTAGAKSPVLIGNRGPITIIYGSSISTVRSSEATTQPGRRTGPDKEAPAQPSAKYGTLPATDCKAEPCAPARRSPTGAKTTSLPSSDLLLPKDLSHSADPIGVAGSSQAALYRRPLFWGVLGGGLVALAGAIVVAVVVPPYLATSNAIHPEWN